MIGSTNVPVPVLVLDQHEHGGSSAHGGVTAILLIVAVALLLAIALNEALRRRRIVRWRFPVSGLLGAALVVVALVTAVASGVAGLPQASETPASPGVPVLADLSLKGHHHASVLVVPNRPGYNLVGIGGTGQASVGTDRSELTAGSRQPGSAQTWIGVQLPAGTSRLRVSTDDGVGSLTVDTGRDRSTSPAALRGADGPECAASAAGAILAGSTRPLTGCPADALSPEDAVSLRSTVRFIAQRGARSVMLAEDDSPRGRAAAATVRAAAREKGLKVTPPAKTGKPMIVVAGWKGADAVIDSVAKGRLTAQGTYLAPWLLTRPFLSRNAGQLIPLRYAPRTAGPMAYVAALSERIPGEYPSAAGYAAWQDARHIALSPEVRLYATALTYVPGDDFGSSAGGGAGGHQHGGDATDWLPGGMIAEVARPLTDGGSA
jgi:multisubunit Na+/H+ antiporter MnhB subunit